MHLKRNHKIYKQIRINKQNKHYHILDNMSIHRLRQSADEQLLLSKVIDSQIQYSKIEIFLTLTNYEEHKIFYNKLKNDLKVIFMDEKSQQTFQKKWTYTLKSNTMRLFAKIASQYHQKSINNSLQCFTKLYAQTILKVMREDKFSRIQQKFLDTFVVQAFKSNYKLISLGQPYVESIYTLAKQLSQKMNKSQAPKTLTDRQFLQYSVLSLLQLPLPHEKYLYTQLVYAPNPKYLLPFTKKGTFQLLTNEILLKSNKIDMVGFKYWSYIPYEDCDIYEKVRRAAEWQNKIQIMKLIIMSRLNSGLSQYLSIINQKLIQQSNQVISQQSINMLISLSEISLQIYRNHSNSNKFCSSLQHIDIGTTFQHIILLKDIRLRLFIVQLIQLYLLLLCACVRQPLKLKYIRNISINIIRIIGKYEDDKLTHEIIRITINSFRNKIDKDGKTQFIYTMVSFMIRQWLSKQDLILNNQIAKINLHVVIYLADVVKEFGFQDYERTDLKTLKLEFFYIMALNFNDNKYTESKMKLSQTSLSLNCVFSSNEVFAILQTKRTAQEILQANLRSIYGKYQINKPEHQGILVVIDEIVSYNIQITKNNNENHILKKSFYILLIDLLQQVDRIDQSGKLLTYVKYYFTKCNNAYMINMEFMKFKDETKNRVKDLVTIDVSYLVEGSISGNPIVADFCQQIIFSYLQIIPELAFYTPVLTVFAECISILYRKHQQQYESKAQHIKVKGLTSSIVIPINIKEVSRRILKLMIVLYFIIIRGHCIDIQYTRTRILYLIKEYCRSATMSFGWKFLKHLISNLRDDKDLIFSSILTNNSCSWFINQSYFINQINTIKADKIVLDKSLLPLHVKTTNLTDLKPIFAAVQSQAQNQFLIIPSKSNETEIMYIIKNIQQNCQRIELLHITHQNSEQLIETEQNKLYDILSRIKMIQINKFTQSYILNRLFDICKENNNSKLLQYILIKVVPYMYCNLQLNSNLLNTISEILHYTVLQLNNCCRFTYETNQDKKNSKNNIFDVQVNCFQNLNHYEEKQNNEYFYEQYKKFLSGKKIYRYMITRLHNRRVFCLKKMYKELVKFLTLHMHVCIGMGIPLTLLIQAFSLNFLMDAEVLEIIPLQSICYCLNSQLELVNVLKSSLEKGEIIYDDNLIDDFYFKTLKMSLLHFQKKKTYYEEDLLDQSHNIKSIKTKINIFIKICDYLRNDDFHKISKKKLPKRNQIFAKKATNNLLIQLLRRREYLSDIRISGEEEEVPFRNSNQNTSFDITVLRYSLLYLISEQIDRTKAYGYSQLKDIKNPYSLAGKKKFISDSQIIKLYNYMGAKSSVLIYNFVRIFQKRIDDPEKIMSSIKQNLALNPDYSFPQFLDIYIDHFKNDKHKLKLINYWKTPNIQVLFKYLDREYAQYPYLQLYVTKILGRLHSEQILFYLPQIFQALTLPSGKIIYDFLLEYARGSASFAHQLIWMAKVQSKQQKDPHNKNSRLPQIQENLGILQILANKIIKNTKKQFTKTEKMFFKQVNDFFEAITAISGKMNPKMESLQKKQIIKEEIKIVKVPKSAYLPINIKQKVISLNVDSGTPMQSAAKCPFLLSFNCLKYEGPDLELKMWDKRQKQRQDLQLYNELQPTKQQIQSHKLPIARDVVFGSHMGRIQQKNKTKNANYNENKSIIKNQDLNFELLNAKSEENNDINDVNDRISEFHSPMARSSQISCIFKVFDDIRQDSLALQIMQLFMQIFNRHSLPLKLFPYKTISNRTGNSMNIGGIIEVLPKTMSRDSIGKTNQQSLYQYFKFNFGPNYDIKFQSARQNFIKSQAAYSIVSYILQIKDRHNGNILINKQEGYIIHIDFGFIFDISPANNLRFEKADFKLTEEMINIMGGRIDSQPFQYYLGLVIKGFLILRKYHSHIINVIQQMFRSGLPCFLLQSMNNLKARFVLDMSQVQAAQHMKQIVQNAADNWTTNWYDRIQWIQQKIYH